MKKLTVIGISALLSLTLLHSCKKETGTPADLGYNYFPTEIGTWVMYHADSIVLFAFSGQTDTFSFDIKEVIDTIFLDAEGRPSQRIERFKRATANDPWILKDVWFSNLNNTTGEKVEENQRFIKLTFPPREGNTWDGNAINILEEWEYEYTEVDISTTINGLTFDSSLTVVQRDDLIPVIGFEYSEEKWARNVGLIYQKYITKDFQGLSDDIDYTMQVTAYGKN